MNKSLEELREEGDLILTYGGSIKALGDGKVGGHLVLFGNDESTDLIEEYFDNNTDFDISEGSRSSIYYDHGLDPTLKTRKLGDGSMEVDEAGVWIEAQLSLRDKYEKAVYSLVEANKLGWSSGTAPHLIEREKKGDATWIKRWPLGLDASLTPTPMEYRNKAIMLKSHLKSQRLDIRELLKDVGETSAVDLVRWTPKHWAEALALYWEVLIERSIER